MKNNLIVLIALITLIACKSDPEGINSNNNENTQKASNSGEMKTALRKHLNAVTNKNIDALKISIPQENDTMFLMLPDGTKMTTAGAFLKMHSDWFADTTSNWHIDFAITYVHSIDNLGYALVEAMLTEPDRKGKPYFHKMHISYVLEKRNQKWLVIKDHASTIEKSE